MSENTKETRGLSAAQARRPVRSAKQPSTRSEPIRYTIRKGDQIVLDAGTLPEVRALFPALRGGLIARRLSGGERDYDRLARPPDPPSKRKAHQNLVIGPRRR